MKPTHACFLVMLSIVGLVVGIFVGDRLQEGGIPAPIASLCAWLGLAAPWLAVWRSRQTRQRKNPAFHVSPSAESLGDQPEASARIPRTVQRGISTHNRCADAALTPFVAVPMIGGFFLSMMWNLAGSKGWIWIAVMAFLVSWADGGLDAWIMTLILMFGLPYAIIRWAQLRMYDDGIPEHRIRDHEWVKDSTRFHPYFGEIAQYKCTDCTKEVQSSLTSLDLARRDCPGAKITYRYDFNKDLRARHPQTTSAIASKITDQRRNLIDDASLEEFKQSFWPPYLIALFLFGMITDGVDLSGDNGILLVLGVALVVSGTWKAIWHLTLTGLALAFFIFAFSVGIVINGREAVVVSLIIVAFIAFLFFVVWRFMRMWHELFGPG